MEKQHSKSKGHRLFRQRKLIASICLMAVWFTFNIGDSLMAGQNEFAVSATLIGTQTGSGMSPNLVAAQSMLATGSGLATLAATIIGIALMGYNLLVSGKRGWGWAAICLAAGVIMMLGRIAIDMFREVSSPNSVQDWDS